LLDRNWEISSQSQGVEKLSEEKMEKMKFLQQKQILKENLFSLPKPKNEFEITIPEIEEEDSNYSKKRELDAEEMEKIERRKKQHVYEETLKMRWFFVIFEIFMRFLELCQCRKIYQGRLQLMREFIQQ